MNLQLDTQWGHVGSGWVESMVNSTLRRSSCLASLRRGFNAEKMRKRTLFLRWQTNFYLTRTFNILGRSCKPLTFSAFVALLPYMSLWKHGALLSKSAGQPEIVRYHLHWSSGPYFVVSKAVLRHRQHCCTSSRCMRCRRALKISRRRFRRGRGCFSMGWIVLTTAGFFSPLLSLATQHEDPGRNWKIYVAHAPGKWTTSVVCRPVCSVCQQGNESWNIHLWCIFL